MIEKFNLISFNDLKFKVNHSTSAIITNTGVGINPEQTAGIIYFIK